MVSLITKDILPRYNGLIFALKRTHLDTEIMKSIL